MKKSLVLAMAMALGVTASAYAANPFSDVPAGHWAYDSISKLAAAGVIEGYGDATFGGDKLMTRYEMAQIVAKAMAKGANCDKLAAEFADELDNLGVRVANLEKKADNVKITGQIRYHYQAPDKGDYATKLRTRLFVKGQVNEDWAYNARLQNEQDFTDNDGEDGNGDFKLNWAYVEGKLGGLKVIAGRRDLKLHAGTVLDQTMDGVKATYGKDVQLTLAAGKAVDKVTNAAGIVPANEGSDSRVYVADVSAKLGVVDTFVTYFKVDDYGQEIYNVGAALKLTKDLKLSAEYLNGDADDYNGDNNGYVVGLAFKGAKAAKVGSYGLYANYFDQPAATYLKPTISAYAAGIKGELILTRGIAGDGFKGFEVGANYTVAKNIVAGVKYYDLEAREGEADNQTLWSEVVFTF
ncbi:MAG: S-layer homology domain-containing protein [Phascolarctobacterium sp.]|nr:S-layer homology domain-containing protein [Phascolarctobacterium sp.]